MQEYDNNIGRDPFSLRIREKLEGHQLPPPAGGWAELEKQVQPPSAQYPIWGWIAGAAAIAACVILLIVTPPYDEMQYGDSTGHTIVLEEQPGSTTPADEHYIAINEEDTELSEFAAPHESAPVVAHVTTPVQTQRQASGISETSTQKTGISATNTPKSNTTPDVLEKNTYLPETAISNIKEKESVTEENTVVAQQNSQVQEELPATTKEEKTNSTTPLWEIPVKKHTNRWLLAVNVGPESFGSSSNNVSADKNIWNNKNYYDYTRVPSSTPSQGGQSTSGSVVEEEISYWGSSGENWECRECDNGIEYEKLVIDNGLEDQYNDNDDNHVAILPQNQVSPLGPEDFPERNYMPPISVGVSVRRELSRIWAIESGLSYSYLSTQFETGTASNQHGTLRLHYIGVPLNVVAKLQDRPGWDIYVAGGGMLEKGLKSEWLHYVGSNSRSTSGSIDGLQWSVQFAAGADYKFHPNMSAYIEPRLSYYFKNKQPISIRTAKPLTFGINIGLRYIF